LVYLSEPFKSKKRANTVLFYDKIGGLNFTYYIGLLRKKTKSVGYEWRCGWLPDYVNLVIVLWKIGNNFRKLNIFAGKPGSSEAGRLDCKYSPSNGS
jgi:hypothetical protein